MVKNNLKQILMERGIKQSWLADKCNIHFATINNIINNKYNCSLDVAFKISNVLNLKINDIFYWEEKE